VHQKVLFAGRRLMNMALYLRSSVVLLVMVLAAVRLAPAQAVPASPMQGSQSLATLSAEQTAHILGFDPLLQRFSAIRAERACGSPANLEELTIRQQILEAVQTASLDLDGVLGELSNEEDELSNLRTSLQTRRDSKVAKYNAIALTTGSGASAVVSATQFTFVGKRTNNVGDGIGIAAGAASILFSILATRAQNGPNGSVGEVPNMLAPLLDGTPVLNTYYPPAVLEYLQTVPVDPNASPGTRLDQLKAEWLQSGRLDPSGSGKRQQKITALTSSSNPDVKVSIGDLSDRIAMLRDVSGRVSLMKRDLGTMMRSYARKSADCTGQP
jgi:hypothetical protein